jgi:signal peptidase I
MFVADLAKYEYSDLIFRCANGKNLTFAELAGDGFVINGSSIELEGVLDAPVNKRITFRHYVGSKVVDVRDLQSTQGEFGCDIELRLGLNRLQFQFADSDKEPLVVKVFNRTTAREWIENLVKALVLVILVKTFVVQAFFIPTGSMEDTLLPRDYILVDKFSYIMNPPELNDIIVFQYPNNFTQDFIKRLVGKEGDKLSMNRKNLFRNGEELDEPWVVHKDFRYFVIGNQWNNRDVWDELTVPDNHYFAMGDNRDFSKDSRFWGPLDKARLKGRAFMIYYPFSRFGLIRHGRHTMANLNPEIAPGTELEKASVTQ